jgi:hypothetical protein
MKIFKNASLADNFPLPGEGSKWKRHLMAQTALMAAKNRTNVQDAHQ